MWKPYTTKNKKQKKEEERACRACLATDRELHDLLKNGLSEKFTQVTSVKIWTIDGKPKHICSFCRAFLLKAYQFRRMCMKIDQLMLHNARGLKYICNTHKASTMPILSISEVVVAEFVEKKDFIKEIDGTAISSKNELEKPLTEANDKDESFNEVIFTEVEYLEDTDEDVNANDVENIISNARENKMSTISVGNMNNTLKSVDTMEESGIIIIIDDSDKSNEKAVYPITVTETKCNIKNELYEITPKVELDENIIETNDPHEAFNETNIPNLELHVSVKIEEDVNAINNQDIHELFNEETTLNTEVKLLKKVEDIESASNSNGKESPTLKENTMKRKQSVSTSNESDIAEIQFKKCRLPTTCEPCDKTFPTCYDLLNHRRRVHVKRASATSSRYGCDICGKMFASKSNIQRHIPRVHNEARPYHCEQCDLGFKTLQYLKGHQNRVHTAGRSFWSDDCDKMFKTEAARQIHFTQKHSQVPPAYPCAQCDMAFISPGHLKIHQLVHKQKQQGKKKKLVYCA